MMAVVLQLLLFLGVIFGFAASQNCPIHGPAYPAVQNISKSVVFETAKETFDKILADALESGQLDNTTSTFSIAVFSIDSDDLIYEFHQTGADQNITVNSDSLYRIGSISKLITVYTILSKLSDKYWDESVTKYVPELSALPAPESPLDGVDWSEVTLGGLASHMTGIGRDYALGDLSATLPGQTVLPGLPPLNDTEIVRCGSNGYRPCTREEAFTKLLTKPTVIPPYQGAIYSNVAFQLLAYAVENITGEFFSSIVESELLTPLNLTRTFLTQPTNDTNAVIVDGWDLDIGEEGPAGAYYQALSDLSTLGKSILLSSIIPPFQTRKWFHPTSHTSSLSVSVGRPWEIFREKINTTTTSNKTRVIDLYTKSGGIQSYISHLALSPDHGLGISFLSGNGGQNTFFYLQEKLYNAWFGSAEAIMRNEAENRFGGVYKGSDNSTVEFKLDDTGEPGLLLSGLISNGTDLLEVFGQAFGLPEGVKLGGWLYPMGRDARTGKVAFRAVFGALGVESGEEKCLSWAGVDQLRYGGHAIDLFVFEVEEGKEKAGSVRVEGLKKVFER
ncbi:beta-lactamase-like protein sdnR [Podospora fimiseda]|uniref:Beta-lactamase-like protein sdnR n=1 Tax=Podospora fimiseda TaxID=252190 RepID=A0AAN7GXR9_9PEZI|nr:beta-lactamase-like protein sdnR [Podospora fimiseda]